MSRTNKSVAILSLLSGLGGGASSSEGGRLHIVTVQTSSPPTLLLDGVDEALDLEIFTIPEEFLPLEAGSTYFALPMAGDEAAPNWGLIQLVQRGGAGVEQNSGV